MELRPLYTIDLDSKSSEKELKSFIKELIDYDKRCLSTHKYDQAENLQFFLGRGPSASSVKNKDAQFAGSLGIAPSLRLDRFRPMTVNHLKDITDNQVAQLAAPKSAFFMNPRNSNDVTLHNKVQIAKKTLETILYERNFELIKERWIRESKIFGESFLLIFWDENLGAINEFAKENEGKELLDKDGSPLKDKSGNIVKVDPLMRNGDVNIKVIDPRSMVIQPANSFEEAEWVIIEDFEFSEKLRFKYPDKASEIKDQMKVEEYDSLSNKYNKVSGRTLVYTLYHRPCPELPKGRIIKYTDDTILENRALPHASLYEENLFPIVPLFDTQVHGSPRGFAGSIYAPGKPLQVAINNLYTISLRNIAKFPPLRLWPKGSLDPDQMRTGAPMDVRFDQNKGTPKFQAVEPISQSIPLLIDRLTQRLMQITNVLPISRGETIPNTESRLMLDFFAQKEREHNAPAVKKINNALTKAAQIILAIASDMYDDEARFAKVFGRRSKFEFQRISKEDLEIPVDIHIRPMDAFPSSPEGKLTHLTQLLQTFPGLVTPQQALDLLEMGDPEQLYDSQTASIDLAKVEIDSLLKGEDVPPPQPWLDLIPYYATYRDALQIPEIRSITPHVFDPNDESIGGKILSQVMAIESILWEKQKNNQVLAQELAMRFKEFPSVFSPEPIQIVDPFEVGENVIPQELLPPPEGPIGA